MTSTLPPGDDGAATELGYPLEQARSAAAGVSSGNALPTGTRLGEFEVTGVVGEGGFGIVYAAYDHSLQRTIALKEYMPRDLAARSGATTVYVRSDNHLEAFKAGLKSFINEARLLAQFDHPSLVKVHRFWEANGTAYMVMPLYQGVTLKAALKRAGRPPDEAWLKDLVRRLIEPLAVLHREHCFHRDIAPDNILILDSGRPLILDFGAARKVIGDVTRALTVILKPGYAPIEQYTETTHLRQGAWTDVYALGAVVHFAITGEAPVASVVRMLSDPMVPLATAAAGRYSQRFLQGIDRALAIRPADRPQDMETFRDLLGLGVDPSEDAVPEPEGVRDSPTTLRVVRRAAGPVVACLVLAGAAYGLLYEPSAPATSQHTDVAAGPALTPAGGPRFSPELALRDVVEGRDPAHDIRATARERRKRSGDRELSLQIQSARAGFVYLLAAGGEPLQVSLLFPNRADADNHISADRSVTFPDRTGSWTLGDPTAARQLVAIVSERPRDFAALQPVPDGLFQKFPADVAARLLRAHEGPAPLFSGRVVCFTREPCADSYGAVNVAIESVETALDPRPIEPTVPEAAEIPPQRGAAAASGPGSAPPQTKDSSSSKAPLDARCSEILEAASLGQPLTPEEQITLERKCR